MKVAKNARAGIDAYLIADPLQGTCTLYTRPLDGAYETCEDFVFGDTVRFTADDTAFVLDTSDWPRLT